MSPTPRVISLRRGSGNCWYRSAVQTSLTQEVRNSRTITEARISASLVIHVRNVQGATSRAHLGLTWSRVYVAVIPWVYAHFGRAPAAVMQYHGGQHGPI